MALSPINIFRPDGNSIEQILGGGNAALSQIMGNAVQMGRDIANRGHAQERDTLAMRQQETALAQRRAENNQQNFEDAARFARNAYEFDTKFGADSAYRQQSLGLQAARDAQSQLNADRNYALSEASGGRAERQLSLQEKEYQRKLDERAAQQAQFDKLFSPEAPAATPPESVPPMLARPEHEPRANELPSVPDVGTPINPGMSTDERMHAQGRVNPYWLEQTGPPVPNTAEPIAERPVAAGAAVVNRPEREQDFQRVAALYEVMHSPNATPAQKTKARGEYLRIDEKLKAEKAAIGKPLTPLQIERNERAAESFDMRKTAAAEKAAEEEAKGWVGDKRAFLPQVDFYTKKYKTWKNVPEDVRFSATEYDKDPFKSELSSARSMDKEAYAAAGDDTSEGGAKLSKELKEKRRKFWAYANAGSELSSAPGSAPSAVDQFMGIK